MGCPSGTVVAKGRGAGLLAEPEVLDRFLYEIFEGYAGKISIKTRIGMEDENEWQDKMCIRDRGKELGTYLYFMTGGEPTVRKADILKLAEKHNDCMFALF